ncbi:uncharacterized protein BJ212DRAFT_1298511 [Suillus subaureus]|uniref:Uncharacterized protein n=1 Tax=Suillus subaureus TaxID=48587 RepID=A0A9P7JFA4_9AGAM|nr:uncharacterized protein BJ212DRAFT_1298511 [Suillus subaureus]KAG1819286.1 hypothetical protein BJ212DRAFT_1298511 [Suillus subaureus]
MKNHAAQATMQKTLCSWLMELLLAHNQHPSDTEIAHVNTAKMDHNLHHHYGVILKFSAAIHILSSQSISPNNVRRGSTALSRGMQGWARMGCHLTPYYHFGMHFAEQMYDFGPCYATWAFAFERHNGKLVRVNHNQHKGAPPDVTQGTAKRQAWYKECWESLSAISSEIYRIVFEYLRHKWHALLHLKPSTSIIGEGENFMGHAKCYSHVWLKKLQYDDDIPNFPWALWATDLGVTVWLAEHLADSEVIPLTALSGHFVLAPIEVHDQKFWITVAYDHTNPEGDVKVGDD